MVVTNPLTQHGPLFLTAAKATGWSEFQIRTHLERLERMEYVHRRTGKQGSLCRYELLIDTNEAAENWQVGLIDVKKLRRKSA